MRDRLARRRRASIWLMAGAMALMLGLWQGVVIAADSPPEDPVEQVGGEVDDDEVRDDVKGEEEGSEQEPSTPPQGGGGDEPTEDDDLPGHETEDPEEPTHAEGSVAHVFLAGEDLVAIGETNASTHEDGHSTGDATVLSLGGTEILGAHADSQGTTEDSTGAQLLCAESGGQVCVELLFAEASATEEGDTSSSHARTALVFACVGGSNPDPQGTCDGPVGAGVSESDSNTETNTSSGESESDQETSLADVCLGPEGEDPDTGACSGIGLNVAQSNSSSSTNGEDGEGSTERNSLIEVEGTPVAITDPTSIALPPDCPDPSLVCLFLNMGESFVFPGGAASRQEAVHLVVGQSGDTVLVEGHLGVAETVALFFNPPPPPPPPPPGCPPVCPPRPELPVTGIDANHMLAGGLLLIVAGAAALAWDRRRLAVQ